MPSTPAMSELAPRAIWFDFGGVLSPPLSDLFDAYEEKTGITPRALHAAMAAVGADLGAHPLAPIELGSITEHEWGARLRAHLAAADPSLDLSRAELESFGGQWFSGIRCNALMASTVRSMRAQGHLVGVLSNNVVEWEPHWHKIIEPAGELDALIDSCVVGVRKPDPKIFRIAEETLGGLLVRMPVDRRSRRRTVLQQRNRAGKQSDSRPTHKRCESCRPALEPTASSDYDLEGDCP